jgi:hypothetical protein
MYVVNIHAADIVSVSDKRTENGVIRPETGS